jgi:hypothetical protein
MTGYDAIDHMVRYRKIETIQKVYVPVIAAVVAALALFVCFPRAGFVGDYAAIIALFAAAVIYLRLGRHRRDDEGLGQEGTGSLSGKQRAGQAVGIPQDSVLICKTAS